MTEERPRDLGLSCGNPAAELRWAPQEVVELHVPGSGLVAIELDTLAGTSDTFNTVLQVRRTCEDVPQGIFPPTCFDDVDAVEFRSRGAFTATGGEVLYIVVTGYSSPPAEQGTVDRGVVRLDITARPDTAPTLTSGFVRLANQDVLVGAVGEDAEADAVGVAMNFLGPTGELLDIYGDGAATMDGDVFTVFFDERPTTAAYDGRALVLGSEVTLAAFMRSAMVSRVVLRAFDSAFATSAPLEVEVEEAELVGLGEACDDEHVCRLPMTCGGDGTCTVTGPAAAVCTGATVIAIEAPTTTATTATVTGTTGAGYGHYEQGCAVGTGSRGAERAYSVVVPEGTFDLIATTDLPGTGSTDTILALRAVCPDSGTELACNDDAAMSNLQSTIEERDLAGGTYFLMVEMFGGIGSGTAPHALQVTLRPVLGAGAACDPAGVQNRCATGACPAAAVCPE
ncbi:hypothetical protein [Sandaracinus amylolyticus]|uniref:hypothetical protein n=1 Tax=Sandaracinus amylolyticus TaxID=927083 RepID=UPI001F1B1F78|nr:hypothetical protein [Sandaracinus amylolyticus]